MRTIETRNVIIGSGCAGLNAADWLYDLGERDTLLVTENMNSGTSRNTGSDKQTYYKLSLCGSEPDSVETMTRTLLGDDVNGDTALCEAANSAKCFFKLSFLGVPFPYNEYGEYAGYQTDHDATKRATSAGPLTSRFMTEALERSVRRKEIPILDHTLAVRLCTDENGICGVDCLDTERREWIHINCAHVILCTGGPAQIYRDVVYPESQHGMSSLAFEAGASGTNLHRWQYGLASVGFRWNVSGSYQQVIPRVVSVDDSSTEREFLAEALGERTALGMTFLKGYQWPFDEEKVGGSSRVDLLVKAQTDLGRRVFLDYRKDPTGFTPENLSPEALDYLTRCGALQRTPYERLKAMNSKAIALYRDHGIDLETQMLEIRVCAQHHNGGISVDANWESEVPGLYVCGEAAGTFGKKRPGGSALNSTQVGSMRAAEHIARVSSRTIRPSSGSYEPLCVPKGDPSQLIPSLQASMSRCAAFVRDPEGIRNLMGQIEVLLGDTEPADLSDPNLTEKLMLRDILITQKYVLSAMIFAAENAPKGIVRTDAEGSRETASRPVPQRDLWFENVWKRYETGRNGR